MDPLRLICEQDGFFTRAMAREVGYDDKAVSDMLRRRLWHRFRRGYYSLRGHLDGASTRSGVTWFGRAPSCTRWATWWR